MAQIEGWSKPKAESDGFITSWVLKELSAFPNIHPSPKLPSRDALTLAGKLLRVQGEDLPPWSWTYRIFVRVPDEDLGPSGRPLSPETGKRMGTTWATATAYLAKDAHEPDSNGQWLLTAAHNVSTYVYECKDDGVIKDPSKKALVLADAIVVVVGYGNAARPIWVDKVAMMTAYTGGSPAVQKFDGAALHIKDSTLLPDSWGAAPPLACIPTLQADKPTIPKNDGFVVPGFPGAINEYEQLAGLYLSGAYSGGGLKYDNFKPVDFDPRSVKSFKGCMLWDNDKTFIAQGQSGAPCVLVVDRQPYIIASVSTDGVGAPFALTTLENPTPTAVDPAALLTAVGAKKINSLKELN